MKLLIAMPLGSRRGGAENALWTLLSSLDRSRIEPVVVFMEAGPFQAEVASLGLATAVVHGCRMRQLSAGVRLVRELATILRRERPDAVLSWMDTAHLYMAPAAALAGFSGPVTWWQQAIPYRRYWSDHLFNALPARAVLCYSEVTRRRQLSLWPRRDVHVVNPGSPPREPVDAAARKRIRARLALPEGRTVISVVGRLDPWKRQDLVIRVLAELARRGLDVHGLMVGDEFPVVSGYKDALHRLVVDVGLSDRVTFTGWVTDPITWGAATDILVNSSEQEPFGLTVIEAMAMGVAVVAFDDGGPAEIIHSGHSGMLVRSGDEQALADTIADLVLDSERRLRLSRNGLKRFRQRFTAKAMCERFASRLESLLETPRAGVVVEA